MKSYYQHLTLQAQTSQDDDASSLISESGKQTETTKGKKSVLDSVTDKIKDKAVGAGKSIKEGAASTVGRDDAGDKTRYLDSAQIRQGKIGDAAVIQRLLVLRRFWVRNYKNNCQSQKKRGISKGRANAYVASVERQQGIEPRKGKRTKAKTSTRKINDGKVR